MDSRALLEWIESDIEDDRIFFWGIRHPTHNRNRTECVLMCFGGANVTHTMLVRIILHINHYSLHHATPATSCHFPLLFLPAMSPVGDERLDLLHGELKEDT